MGGLTTPQGHCLIRAKRIHRRMELLGRSWTVWMRAVVITFALAVHCMIAAPSPHAVDKTDLRRPEGREEIDRWRSLLATLGLKYTRAELSDEVVYWTSAINRVHRRLRSPFRPWLRTTGTGQAWALFASPDTHPHRLEVFVHVEGEWVPIFKRNQPGYDFLDSTFRYRRVRGVYDGSTHKQRIPYWNFTRWVARKALVAYPDADQVKIHMVRTHTTLPWEPVDLREKARAERVITREAAMSEDGS